MSQADQGQPTKSGRKKKTAVILIIVAIVVLLGAAVAFKVFIYAREDMLGWIDEQVEELKADVEAPDSTPDGVGPTETPVEPDETEEP